MNVSGIVVEYNPLHNGHIYHIKKTRELSKCDCLVAVMSGNFVQRGEPAIFNKYQRTQWALEAGIDLVIELPFAFTVQNADLFAFGAISILNELFVDEIYFGSEENNIQQLYNIVDIYNTSSYQIKLKEYLSSGLSYPNASANAINDISNIDTSFYHQPNNILGIQYLNQIRKLKSKMKPYLITRIHNNYHDNSINNTTIQSATAIRRQIIEKKDYSDYVPFLTLPREYVDINMFTTLLKYKLISTNKEQLSNIHLVNEGIENRLLKYDFESIDELIQKAKTKRYTTSRLKRTIIHILCNTKNSYDLSKITYLRILGMDEIGQSYLNRIKKKLTIPLISKISEIKDPLLELELTTSKIYRLVDKRYHHEQKFPIIHKNE